jgi:DNA-binding NarL/FixJ family response regulator
VRKTIRLQVVDPQKLFRDCLAAALDRQEGIEIIGGAASLAEVVFNPSLQDVDVLLLSLDCGDKAGIALVRELSSRAPGLKVLLLGHDDSEERILACLRGGAKGYLSRRQSLAELLDALDIVARGETVCPPRVAYLLFSRLGQCGLERRLHERLDRFQLTPRELEILRLVAAGLGNADIARRLGLSIHTVKNHVHKVLETLGVSSRMAAVNYAFAKGWLADWRQGA